VVAVVRVLVPLLLLAATEALAVAVVRKGTAQLLQVRGLVVRVLVAAWARGTHRPIVVAVVVARVQQVLMG
jgi:hypothetical protein